MINNKMNKKGWIRIVEATIAILIIMTVLITISQIKQKRFEKDLSEDINPLLEEIAKNVTMREKIINDDIKTDAEKMINDFVENKLKNPSIGNNVTICDINEVCGLDSYPTNIQGNLYAKSRVISAVLEGGGANSNPKKITLFLWVKE